MKYKKNKLTSKQFAINNQQKYDTKSADSFLKQNGLIPATFEKLDLKVAQAKIAAHALEEKYSKYLSNEHIKKINEFNRKVINSKKCHLLKPSAAYPILNLASKIKRQAYKEELLIRQK